MKQIKFLASVVLAFMVLALHTDNVNAATHVSGCGATGHRVQCGNLVGNVSG